MAKAHWAFYDYGFGECRKWKIYFLLYPSLKQIEKPTFHTYGLGSVYGCTKF